MDAQSGSGRKLEPTWVLAFIRKENMKKVAIIVITVLGLTVCGTASANEIAKVRQTEYKVLTLFSSNHPATACKYYTVAAHDDCLEGIIMAQSMGFKVSDLFPSGWKTRLAKAKIIVHGNRAKVSPIMGTNESTHLVKINGRWLIS